MARKLFVFNLSADPDKSLMAGLTSDVALDPQTFFRGDVIEAECYFRKDNPRPTPGRPYIFLDPPATFKLAARQSSIYTFPTGGTFTITVPAGGTTSALAYNASAATVQTALRLLTDFTACVVTGDDGGPWTVQLVGAGAVSGTLTFTTAGLIPNGSTGWVTNPQDGSGTQDEVFYFGLHRAYPMLRASGWTGTPTVSVGATIVQNGSASANKVYAIEWNNNATGGNVWLSVLAGGTTMTVGPISYAATVDEFREALEAHTGIAEGDVEVSEGDEAGSYEVTFTGTLANSNTPTIATSSDTLFVPSGLLGTLTLSTYGCDLVLDGEVEADVVLEAEATFTVGQPETICNTPAKFSADVIINNPGSETGDEIWATVGDLAAYLPPGSVMPYAGASEPSGWLFCYGQAVSRATYAALFSAIGTVGGVGDGSTTFNIPDLRGRVVAGQDDMGGVSADRLTAPFNGDTLGVAGGSEFQDTAPTEEADASVGAGGVFGFISDTAKTTVQPTMVLNYIIRT